MRKTDGLAFWTLTLWRDMAAMRSFVIASPHKEVMQKLANWCDEAAFAHWNHETNDLPMWDIAVDKLRASGHLGTVLHPSEKHKAGKIVVSSTIKLLHNSFRPGGATALPLTPYYSPLTAFISP